MYAQAYDCPNCGAPVAFDSAIAVFAVCAHCRSSVVRRDAQVELMGQQAQLPPDLSPLQVGTRGTFDGRSFTLTGRVRVGYPEGSWNEWCADFGNGLWGWVAEAQGWFQVSFEMAPPAGLPGLEETAAPPADGVDGLTLVTERLELGRRSLPLGRRIPLSGSEYTVRDSKQTNVLGSEGSLPFVALPGRSAISVDLSGPGRGFANVEYSADGIRVFVGRHCPFAELAFGGLRPLPGWTAEAEVTRNQSDALNCAACGAPLTLRAAGLTMTAVCPSCAALVDTSQPQVQLVDTATRRQAAVPLRIPIGQRGTFGGVEYECIGMLQRQDNYSETWQEYLLFNPFAGFRWLVTFQGHWSWVEPVLDEPRMIGDRMAYEGRPYRQFAVGFAQVIYVLGEFYWQVRLRERTEVADFIAPPYVLSSEKYPDLTELTWSHGRYLEPTEVQTAFKLTTPLREPLGVYLNQPNPHTDKGRTLRWLLPLFAGIVALLALIGAGSHASESVASWTFTPNQAGTNGAIVSEPFVVGGTHAQSLEITLEAGVQNGWLETGLDLVDAQQRVVRETGVEVAFYDGYDEGYWSEGSRRRSVLLSSLPPGTYRMVIEPTLEPMNAQLPFTLSLRRDVMVWSNVILGIVLLLIYPVFRWVREHAFERNRWEASDFSPYHPAGGDDGDDGDDD